MPPASDTAAARAGVDGPPASGAPTIGTRASRPAQAITGSPYLYAGITRCSTSARLNADGCSTFGRCAAAWITVSRACGMPSARTRASSGVVAASPAPTTTSVGALMSLETLAEVEAADRLEAERVVMRRAGELHRPERLTVRERGREPPVESVLRDGRHPFGANERRLRLPVRGLAEARGRRDEDEAFEPARARRRRAASRPSRRARPRRTRSARCRLRRAPARGPLRAP